MKQFLTTRERDQLQVQHRKERDKRVCDRIKAVLLSDAGWSLQEIAYVLLLSNDAVKQHIQDYQDSQKLKPENGGSSSKLNAEQTSLLVQHLKSHTYTQYKTNIWMDSSWGAQRDTDKHRTTALESIWSH